MKVCPQWVRDLLCRKWCPEYLEKMPVEDKPGRFISRAYVHGFTCVVYSGEREVEGLVAAYKEARWMALWLDFWSSGSLGVRYGVKPLDKICNT